jgi:hypothetical protein
MQAIRKIAICAATDIVPLGLHADASTDVSTIVTSDDVLG